MGKIALALALGLGLTFVWSMVIWQDARRRSEQHWRCVSIAAKDFCKSETDETCVRSWKFDGKTCVVEWVFDDSGKYGKKPKKGWGRVLKNRS